MARPIKKGIDYFPLDVDIFSDEKIVPISVEFGIKGEIIVIRLLCAIYRNGYFLEWSELMKFKFAKDMPSVSSDLLDSVVDRLVKWKFFDRLMFSSHNVLTSAAIQRRYFSAVRKRRRPSSPSLPFLLIDIDPDTQPKQPVKTPKTPAPPPSAPLDDDASLTEFFDDRHRADLLLLCKNFSLSPDGLPTLRSLANAVISEWKLTNTTHSDYSDWSRHLISSMRIKCRAMRHSDNAPITDHTPSSLDYSLSGGFGSQDI